MEKENYVINEYSRKLHFQSDIAFLSIYNNRKINSAVVFVARSLRISHFCCFSPRRVNKFGRLLCVRWIRLCENRKSYEPSCRSLLTRYLARRTDVEIAMGICAICRWILFAYRISLTCYAAGESVCKDFCGRDRIITREGGTQNCV